MAKTTITKDGKGQYRVTVPRALADAQGLDGTKVEWKMDGDNIILIPQ